MQRKYHFPYYITYGATPLINHIHIHYSFSHWLTPSFLSSILSAIFPFYYILSYYFKLSYLPFGFLHSIALLVISLLSLFSLFNSN